jgi:OmpA-OmpF porin, OOP family
MKKILLSLSILLLSSTAIDVVPVEGQIGRRLRDAAGRAVERETTRQVERRITEEVRCAFDDDACIAEARREGREVEITGGAPAADSPTAGAFLNFDFVPGDRVLYADDFARDQVGDFPRRLEFVAGNMETAEWGGGRWLRGTSWPSTFEIPLPESLPQRFTVEMEVVPGRGGQHLELHFAERAEHHVSARYFQGKASAGISRANGAVAVGNTTDDVAVGTPFLLRVMGDGAYVKVYANGVRVANVPNSSIGRSNRIRVELPGGDDTPGFVRNIRVAAGGRQLYEAISSTGRVATQGIYFDTGSDRIRPESAPTLREIGEMMREHSSLRLRIEGHTDSVGDDAANQQLSERRAAAVKAHLEREFDLPASRLEATGMGETVPAATNDTAEGRQQNRRVELVRL